MDLTEIEIYKLPFFSIDTDLSGTTVTLQFKWNDTGQFYTLDVLNRGQEPIIRGIKINKNVPLINRFGSEELPTYGDLYIYDTGSDDAQPDPDTFGERFRLIYADWSQDEIDDLVELNL